MERVDDDVVEGEDGGATGGAGTGVGVGVAKEARAKVWLGCMKKKKKRGKGKNVQGALTAVLLTPFMTSSPSETRNPTL